MKLSDSHAPKSDMDKDSRIGDSNALARLPLSRSGRAAPADGVPIALGDYTKTALTTLAALSAVFLVSALYRPPDEPYFTICAFKWLTGLPCPGCGLTHSFCALGHGNLVQAIQYNALGPIFFLGAALLWVRSGLIALGRQRPARAMDQLSRRLRLGRILLLALVAFGAARILLILIRRH
jgi:hypothetical protein